MAVMLWTEEEISVLKTMHEKGIAVRDMAKVLRRSEESVRAKMRSLGLQLKHIRNIDYVLLEQLLRAESVEI